MSSKVERTLKFRQLFLHDKFFCLRFSAAYINIYFLPFWKKSWLSWTHSKCCCRKIWIEKRPFLQSFDLGCWKTTLLKKVSWLQTVSDGAVTKIVGYGFSRLSSSQVWVVSVMELKRNCWLWFNIVIKKTRSGIKIVSYLLVSYAATSKKNLSIPKKGFFHDFNQKLPYFSTKNHGWIFVS